MNRLSSAKRAAILTMLVEGASMRSISRNADVSINTVAKLLNDVGMAAKTYHDEHVCRIRGRRRIECRRTWAFSYRIPGLAQAAREAWTFAGIDTDSRLIVSCLVGDEDRRTTDALIGDVRRRLQMKPELSTDDLRNLRGDGDRVQRADAPHAPTSADVSPPMTNRSDKRRLEKHEAMINLYALHYNFCRVHPELAATPAMRAGLDGIVRDAAWIVELINARAAKPNRPKTYRRRITNSN